jgi:arsenical pump membrane protein
MTQAFFAHILIWSISILSIVLMLIRPWGIPEFIWTTAGALLLLVLRLMPKSLAGHAIAEGTDVYLFLTGMMLLSELAKYYGVFDWLASLALNHAKGSAARLFLLIYGVGTIVTIFMSNDATAVVLTPAVLASVKKAKTAPLPYLFICAVIANAASFVLPISNPANLVVFHGGMPALAQWLSMFALPSFVSILATYALLRWYWRHELKQSFVVRESQQGLSTAGKIVFAGIGGVAVVLLLASALEKDLGLPTFLSALVIAGIVSLHQKENPVPLVREISWGILPLVAALFVIVEAVKSAGALAALKGAFAAASHWPTGDAALVIGSLTGLGTNLVNNLPLGLIAGATLHSTAPHIVLTNAVMIGVDLGPNLSITGSLATILWLIALRREGLEVSGLQFLKVGLVVMPPALMLTIAAAVLLHAHS